MYKSFINYPHDHKIHKKLNPYKCPAFRFEKSFQVFYSIENCYPTDNETLYNQEKAAFLNMKRADIFDVNKLFKF